MLPALLRLMACTCWARVAMRLNNGALLELPLMSLPSGHDKASPVLASAHHVYGMFIDALS
jgi:hypothetical protein